MPSCPRFLILRRTCGPPLRAGSGSGVRAWDPSPRHEPGQGSVTPAATAALTDPESPEQGAPARRSQRPQRRGWCHFLNFREQCWFLLGSSGSPAGGCFQWGTGTLFPSRELLWGETPGIEMLSLLRQTRLSSSLPRLSVYFSFYRD